MACTCEFLIDTVDIQSVKTSVSNAFHEIKRIEHKYNRFKDDSMISTINRTAGIPTELDEETLLLMQYAKRLFELSGGLFDISSGKLRHLWHFHRTNARQTLPDDQAIKEAIKYIGFEKISLRGNQLLLKESMELDIGGIGKEYAADKALQVFQASSDQPILINLGGDIVVSDSEDNTWQVGVGDTIENGKLRDKISISKGALATSGTSQRRWNLNGRVYSHILNPKTGWPIEEPPLCVTVAAPTCSQAGMLSTLVMLQGKNAETFCNTEGIQGWINR